MKMQLFKDAIHDLPVRHMIGKSPKELELEKLNEKLETHDHRASEYRILKARETALVSEINSATHNLEDVQRIIGEIVRERYELITKP